MLNIQFNKLIKITWSVTLASKLIHLNVSIYCCSSPLKISEHLCFVTLSSNYKHHEKNNEEPLSIIATATVETKKINEALCAIFYTLINCN
jgi:hypothetical protein